ncbi:MAG TPA: hypothetical protein ENJ35_11590, partial [Gammaproteobacteria bacterium]|nr:hypothetical protein [Gammaproteobacteria bacterium]
MDTTMKAFIISTIATSLLLGATSAIAKGEIYTINTEAVPATPSSYVANGVQYQWGLGMDLKLKSFQYQGETLQYNKFRPDRVNTIRVDNANADGWPCAVYAQTAGTAHSYQPTLPPEVQQPDDCSLGLIIAGNTINLGALDVFSNSGPRDYALKNIERVDLIFSNGIIAPENDLATSGHTVMEKNGNNTIQIAAILKLDENGNPAAYGPLVKVNKASFTDTDEIQYGKTNISTFNDFLSNESRAPQGFMVRREALAE